MRKFKLFKWLTLLFEPRDFWVGLFADLAKRRLYILPVPCLGFVIEFDEWRYLKLKVLPWQSVRGFDGSVYLTRIKLFPKLPWGQPYLHIFRAPDPGFAPHDHGYDFWTFPFTTYAEEVLNTHTGDTRISIVRRREWQWRPAEHTHRVVSAPYWPFCTLFWQGPQRRKWGHWCLEGGLRRWIYWRDYVAGGGCP